MCARASLQQLLRVCPLHILRLLAVAPATRDQIKGVRACSLLWLQVFEAECQKMGKIDFLLQGLEAFDCFLILSHSQVFMARLFVYSIDM